MLLLSLQIGWGCASPTVDRFAPSEAPPSPARSPGSDPGPLPVVPRQGAGDLAVVRVGDAEIRRSDLGDFVMRYFRDEAGEALTHLTDERILLAEAAQHGIEIAPSLVSASVDRELRERESTIKLQFGTDTTLEGFLRDRYGVTLEQHREDLARLVKTGLIRDRVIRFDQMRSDRVEVRDAVFLSEAEGRAAATAARNGADLAALARESGIRPGVELPPFPPSQLSPPELATKVSALAVGEVSDALAVWEDGRTVYHVFKMVRKLPARTEPWAAVRGEIESTLEGRPVESWEYLEWARGARERYRVEVVR